MQKRTTRAKKFAVFIDNLIVKFPYTEIKTNTIRGVYARLNEMGCEKISPPLEYKVMNNDIEGLEGNRCIVYENIGNPDVDQLDVINHTDRFKPYLNYKIVKERINLVKLSNFLSENKNNIELISNQITSVVCTLIAVRALGVGDSHLTNVLINLSTNELTVIDFDERSSTPIPDNPFFYVSMPIKESYREAWNNYIDRDQVLEFVTRNRAFLGDDYDTILHNCSNINFGKSITSKVSQEIEVVPIASNLGQMKYGVFSAITYSGFPFDQVKSQLQKSIRRGETIKALMCAVEGYRMRECGGLSNVSNICNRIAVIAAEDVGPASINLVILAVNEMRRMIREQSHNYAMIMTIVKRLCDAKKTRVLSHVRRTYGTTEGIALAKRLNVEIDNNVSSQEILQEVWRYSNNMNLNTECFEAFCMFAIRLKQKRFTCYQWMERYMELMKDRKISSLNRSTNPKALIWNELSLYLSPEVYSILKEADKEIKHEAVFRLLAVFICINDINPRIISIKVLPNIPQEYMNGEYELIISDEAIDKHTKAGRMQGKDAIDFVNQGALVNNEDQTYCVGQYETFKRIYIESR